MRVAVVGGGLFGCTAAIYAKRAGHEVHLYETKADIMQGASGRSFYRLHRGYHYPRSPETGRECIEAEASFRSEYGGAVIDSGTQHYVIASDSKVDGPSFAYFMERQGLPFIRDLDHDLVWGSEWIFDVQEPRIDCAKLTALVRGKLDAMHVHLGTPMPYDALRQFDQIIVAGYADMNTALAHLKLPTQAYKFQVVEKPVVRLPKEFKDQSLLVMDHCCVDPEGSEGLHVLGHVLEMTHHENVGAFPEVPHELTRWLREGFTAKPPQSRFKSIAAAVARFIPEVRKAEHIGSVLTVRTVLPGQERTDARPTLVERIHPQVVRVFSGKLGTAVTAALEAVAELRNVQAKVA